MTVFRILRAGTFLLGVALLVLASLALLYLPLGPRACLDRVGPGFREPCVQPVETPQNWLTRTSPVLAPAAAGVLLIVGASVAARRAQAA
jgi:hypothetical protein